MSTTPGRGELRQVCGLDIVDADKANLLGRYAIQAQRNIDVARRQNACRGANQLILDVNFLIALGGAADLPRGHRRAKGRQRIV